MRVVITGGTGMIGSELTRNLTSDGHEVIILSRNPEKKAKGIPAGVKVTRWDGRTADGWVEYADGADAIVNLAGVNLSGGRWTKRRKEEIISSRVNAGQAVVQAVERAKRKPGVVIQQCGVNYYGIRGDEKITEKASAGKDFLAQVCVQWEASTAGVEPMGVRRAICRSGVVLSKNGGALPLMALPFRLFVGGSLGSGDQWLSWIHIQDEARALRFLIEKESAKGPFNLTTPNPISNRGFSKTLAGVLKRPSAFRVPAFLIKLIFGEMSIVVLEGQRAFPNKLLDLGFAFRFPQAEAALKDIYGA